MGPHVSLGRPVVRILPPCRESARPPARVSIVGLPGAWRVEGGAGTGPGRRPRLGRPLCVKRWGAGGVRLPQAPRIHAGGHAWYESDLTWGFRGVDQPNLTCNTEQRIVLCCISNQQRGGVGRNEAGLASSSISGAQKRTVPVVPDLPRRPAVCPSMAPRACASRALSLNMCVLGGTLRVCLFELQHGWAYGAEVGGLGIYGTAWMRRGSRRDAATARGR